MLESKTKAIFMKVTVIPTVTGVLRTVSKGLVRGLAELKIEGRIETIQPTGLLRSALILRRFLETGGDMLSFRLQWKTIRLRWCEILASNNDNNNPKKLNTWNDLEICSELCSHCNILTFGTAVNQETGASGRRYQDIILTDWIRCNCDAHGKQVDVKQLYNPVPELESVSWSSSCISRQWEPAPSKGLGPSGPPVEQPSRMRKKCCYSQRNLGSICSSLFSLQLTSHTQPFRNPFE